MVVCSLLHFSEYKAKSFLKYKIKLFSYKSLPTKIAGEIK